MRRTSSLLCLLASCGTAACGAFAGDCTSEARAMIVATVTDADTGAPLVAGVTLLAASETARDSMVVPEGSAPGSVTAVTLYEGRLGGGTYTVEVRRNGYRTWRRTNVRIREDRCGHTTAAVFAVPLAAEGAQVIQAF